MLGGLLLFALPLNAQVKDSLVVSSSSEPINDCTMAVPQGMVKVSGGCDAELKPHGHWVFSHRTGQKSEEGDYVHGKKAGVWSTWNTDGMLLSETTYSDTTTNYVVRTYWHDGRSPKSETTFDANGKWLIQTNWDHRGRRSSYPNMR